MEKRLKRLKIEQLESLIYKTYYQQNPDGDPRFVLWPQVIQAMKQRNKKDALITILKGMDYL